MLFSIPYKNSAVRPNPMELHLKAASSQLGAGPLEHDRPKFQCHCYVMSPPCVHLFLFLLPGFVLGKEKGMEGDNRESDVGILGEDGAGKSLLGGRAWPGSVSSQGGEAVTSGHCSLF